MILNPHKILANNYDNCLTKNGDQKGKLAVYEQLITNGLESRINSLQQEQILGY